ncbi:MAG TPA: hypothetical protein VNS32_15730 [Flavisolibacter sp.]|nr:hypothetical protein [Flavisolibacter sp.]
MAIDPTKPLSNQEEEKQKDPKEQFESDTQRIIHRHLADPDDIITDEDIKKVRIGMMPPSMETPDEMADRFEEELNLPADHQSEEEPRDRSEELPPNPWQLVDD